MNKQLILAILAAQGSLIGAMEQSPVLASSNQASSTISPLEKKRKAGHDQEEHQIVPVYPQVFFNSAEIENAIQKVMVEEEGKIWAAYYVVTSEKLTSWWAGRKYIQEFDRAKKAQNIHAIMNADRFKNSTKEDILIVDQESLKEGKDVLNKLLNTGIQVLVRNKKRMPASSMQKMHYKFMIVFDKENKQGKLLLKGSWNMTNQAHFNWEDVEITNDTRIINRYIDQHQDLRQYCQDYKELQPALPQANRMGKAAAAISSQPGNS